MSVYEGRDCANSPMLDHPGLAREEIDLHPLVLGLEDLGHGAPFDGEFARDILLPGLWVVDGEDADELAIHVGEFGLCLLVRRSSLCADGGGGEDSAVDGGTRVVVRFAAATVPAVVEVTASDGGQRGREWLSVVV